MTAQHVLRSRRGRGPRLAGARAAAVADRGRSGRPPRHAAAGGAPVLLPHTCSISRCSGEPACSPSSLRLARRWAPGGRAPPAWSRPCSWPGFMPSPASGFAAGGLAGLMAAASAGVDLSRSSRGTGALDGHGCRPAPRRLADHEWANPASSRPAPIPSRFRNWLRMATTASLAGLLLAVVVDSVIRHAEGAAASAAAALSRLRLAYRRLEHLHARLEAAKEDERVGLSAELHEGLAQPLSALKHRLQIEEAASGNGDTGLRDDRRPSSTSSLRAFAR